MFFVAILAFLVATHEPRETAWAIHAKADVTATSVLAYRESVIDYLNSNSAFTGTVPDASLTYPWGHQRNLAWTNLVSSGTLYIYEVTPGAGQTVQDTIYTKTQRSFMVGRNVSGLLVSAKGVETGITVPAAIPEGSILIVGK